MPVTNSTVYEQTENNAGTIALLIFLAVLFIACVTLCILMKVTNHRILFIIFLITTLISGIFFLVLMISTIDSSDGSLTLTSLIIFLLFLIFSIVWLIFSRKKHKGISSIFAAILLTVSLGFAIYNGVSIGTILHISDKDISITRNEEGILSQEFELKAKKDIDDLEVTFTFYNSENKVVGMIIKTFPFVKENNTYLISIAASDFSFSDLLTVNSFSWEITGGKGAL